VSADPKIISPASDTEHPVEPGRDNPQSGSLESPQTVGRKQSWQIWLLRVRALLFVTLCATFGVLLLILPWTPKWTDNPLLMNFPDLREVVSSGFVRGLASGLGILDLWLGFWEAINYNESKAQASGQQ